MLFSFCYLKLQHRLMQNQLKDNEESIDEFNIVRPLAQGYTAQVKLGLNPEGKLFAIKHYTLEPSALVAMNNELTIMKELQHNNILQIVGVRENAVYKKGTGNQGCFAVILQFAEEGELFDYILQTGKLNDILARSYFKALISALRYIHDKGFSHRDLKLQNLLLNAQFILKVADFGFSCSLKGHDGFGLLKTRVGSENYMAPEILTNQYDGKKIDIFSAGVILFTIHAGNPPFEKATKNDPHYKLIKEKRFTQFWQAQSKRRTAGYFSQTFKNLIENMLAFEQNERISMELIQNHAWMKGQTSSAEQIAGQFMEKKKKLLSARQLKKKKLNQQKKRRNESISSQGYNSRDNETVEDKQFLAIYNKQQVTPLKLQEFQYQSKEDIVVKLSDIIYTISLLKYYLSKHRVLACQEEQTEQIITEGPDEYIFQSLSTQENKIEIHYKFSDGLKNECTQSELVVSVVLGSRGGVGVLRFSKLVGCDFYFRKVLNDIRLSCLL